MGRDTLLMRTGKKLSKIQILDLAMGIFMQIYFLFPWIGNNGTRCNTLQYLWREIKTDNLGELYHQTFFGEIASSTDNIAQIAQIFMIITIGLVFLQLIFLVYMVRSVLDHRGKYTLHILLMFYSYILMSSDWNVSLIEDFAQFMLPRWTYMYWLAFLAICGTWIFLQTVLQNQENKEERFLHMEQMNIELERQVKREKEQVESLMNSYGEQRRLTHDFRNQLLALDGLLKRREYQEMQVYLTQLLDSDIQLERMINTGNPMIDVLLGRAYKEAKQKGILIEFEVGDLQELRLQDDEVVIVLSNLLDNAIEAAEGAEKEKRIIFRLKRQEEFFVLAVLNTTSEDTKSQSAKNHLIHGYGLQNVKRVLDKNGGEYAVQCENGWYQFTALIR